MKHDPLMTGCVIAFSFFAMLPLGAAEQAVQLKLDTSQAEIVLEIVEKKIAWVEGLLAEYNRLAKAENEKGASLALWSEELLAKLQG